MKGLLLFTVLILAMTVSVAYSLTLLDNLVHGTFYSYGLRFSYDWAAPYLAILRTTQTLVGLTAMLTLTSTIYVYRKHIHAKPTMKMTVSKKLVDSSVVTEPQTRNLPRPFKCPHCEKFFSQPLQMLDFNSDKPGIVNICPFCNKVIEPMFLQEQSEQIKKTLEEKKNKQPKVVQKSQETRQEQPKEETKETVMVQTP